MEIAQQPTEANPDEFPPLPIRCPCCEREGTVYQTKDLRTGRVTYTCFKCWYEYTP